jgi:hypothetical protein
MSCILLALLYLQKSLFYFTKKYVGLPHDLTEICVATVKVFILLRVKRSALLMQQHLQESSEGTVAAIHSQN